VATPRLSITATASALRAATALARYRGAGRGKPSFIGGRAPRAPDRRRRLSS
jgi:hypothetical protein